MQEIADITANGRYPENLKRLSPAICPDCTSPTGNNSATHLTMEQLCAETNRVTFFQDRYSLRPVPSLSWQTTVFIAAVFMAAKKLNTMRWFLVAWLSGACRYARVDIACDHGVVDWSGFTFLEIAKAAGSATLGHRYMEALAYFRTGLKGQIPSGI
jgi:hypothetical protein